MAERFKAAVLKTVEAQVSGGSNPSLSATARQGFFYFGRLPGEVPERLNGTVSKTVVWATVPGVQIPPSPLNTKALNISAFLRYAVSNLRMRK